FAGFIGYAWGADGLNVSQDEMIHFEDTYSTNPLPRSTSISLPYIIEQPQSQTAWLGTNLSLRVLPAGNTPLRYQWRLNAAPLAGATNNPLTLTNIQASAAGVYSVTASYAAGGSTSSSATLTIF